MRSCLKCSEVKDETEFYKDRNRKDGLRTKCKVCWNEDSLTYYYTNKESLVEKRKDYHYRRTYGISLEERDSKEARQNGRCMICNEEKALVVDHCHDSGKVRDMLCITCNQALGMFKEDKEILERAIIYIDKHHR